MTVLLHGWGNTAQSYFVLSYTNQAANTLYSLVPWAIAFFLIKRYGEEHLAPHTRPMAPPAEAEGDGPVRPRPRGC